jgi:hypothetical protein
MTHNSPVFHKGGRLGGTNGSNKLPALQGT